MAAVDSQNNHLYRLDDMTNGIDFSPCFNSLLSGYLKFTSLKKQGLMRKNGVCFCQNFLDDFSFEPFINSPVDSD